MKTQKKLMLLCLLIMTAACSEDDSGTSPVEIESTLTTSKAAYQNASNGDWIQITELEYNLLATELNNVSRVGTTEEQYDFEPSTFRQSDQTLANNNGINIPINSYVFAFKYHTIRPEAPSIVIKQSSTSVTEGYRDIGNPIPDHEGGGNIYFVIKGNNLKTTSEGFLAVYIGKGNSTGMRTDITDSMTAQGNRNTNSLSLSSSIVLHLYQGLSTPEKQWD
ncbi:MAG: hypothetical protein QNJ57_12920 [Flavobacteriaceae bacterium]|nr:hypothetical protein [Flavobacteriaceae bacterium]